MNPDIVFEPLRFRNPTVKNRLLRSNIARRFDFFNGSGSQARLNFEEGFAKGGVGALISSHIRRTITEGYCDGVAIARALVANPDLVKIFAESRDLPEKPCPYCNKCLLRVVEDPFGCYDVSRYDGDYDRMMRDPMSVFQPSL